MDKVNPYNYQNNKVNEAIFKLDEMMEKLTIDHLIPYSGHKLGLMDLSSLGHIPTTMILEGFDLHLKDKPLIAERTNWSLEEIKPILHPLSDFKNTIAKDLMKKFNCSLNTIQDVWKFTQNIIKIEDIKYSTYLMFCKNHIDFNRLIESELAIDINI